MKNYFWLHCLAALCLTLATAALAGEAATEQVRLFKLKTGDGETVEADLSDLAVGESRTFVTDSGHTIDLLQSADGLEVYIDGELQDPGLDGSALHEHHVTVDTDGEWQCFADEGEDCDAHAMVFIDTDGSVQDPGGTDAQALERHIEVICDENEECDQMVWVSADDETAAEAGGDTAQVHKIIRIHRVTDGTGGN